MKTNILDTLAKTLMEVSAQLNKLTNTKSGPIQLELPPKRGTSSSTKGASPDLADAAAQKRAALAYAKLKKGGNTYGVVKPPVLVRSNANHLTPEQIADIAVLLTKSELTVADIAALYNKTKPTIYTIRDKMGLQTHKASPELMAGLARRKAELALKKSGLRVPSLAPFEGYLPTDEQVQEYTNHKPHPKKA